MSTPFTFNGVLLFPADPGVSPVPINVNLAAAFNQLIAETEALTGSGTKSIDLSVLNGGLGANLVLVKVDAQPTPQMLNLRWNGGSSTGEQEVSTGGFFMVGSPNPTAGLTALELVWTAPMTVRVWALGL